MTAMRTPPVTTSRQVTIRPAPRREPPFDDELGPARTVVIGPLDQPLPFGPDVDVATPSPLRLVRPADPFAARPTARAALPDPAQWSRRLLATMFEVVAGRRPARQLTSLASATVCAGFTASSVRTGRMARLVSASGGPQIRSVHVGEPADGVAEVAVTVAARGRVHAVALRLEGLDGRWRCVRLQVG